MRLQATPHHSVYGCVASARQPPSLSGLSHRQLCAMMSSPADRRFYWTVNFKDPPCLNTSMPMLATPS